MILPVIITISKRAKALTIHKPLIRKYLMRTHFRWKVVITRAYLLITDTVITTQTTWTIEWGTSRKPYINSTKTLSHKIHQSPNLWEIYIGMTKISVLNVGLEEMENHQRYWTWLDPTVENRVVEIQLSRDPPQVGLNILRVMRQFRARKLLIPFHKELDLKSIGRRDK